MLPMCALLNPHYISYLVAELHDSYVKRGVVVKVNIPQATAHDCNWGPCAQLTACRLSTNVMTHDPPFSCAALRCVIPIVVRVSRFLT